MTIDLDARVGRLLKVASLLSTALLAAGLGVSLITADAAAGPILTQAGLLIVFATPVVRVLTSLIGFLQQRDWSFVALTVVLLGVLATSVVVALR